MKLWKDLSFYLNILQNFFILISFGEATDPQNEAFVRDRLKDPVFPWLSIDYQSSLYTNEIFQIIGIMMIFCSSFVVFLFLIKTAPLILRETINDSKLLLVYAEKGFVIKIVAYLILSIKCLIYLFYDFEVIYYISKNDNYNLNL